ncbi:MAG: hypothetical protein HY534_08190 [Chloroflexi bacterium]|nr:hypothetical protein [Chloroflexota bacterium]
MSEPNAILRVTPETPVYSHDGQKLGKVAEVRGQAFKVETGLFQRDYWVGADSIESAAASEAVMLTADKGDVASHRIPEPPKAA